jgi:N-sulfoglucosamine sulfohydrolase
MNAPYGQRTVGEYINRPKFELFNISKDPHEKHNLAADPKYRELLDKYKAKLKAQQKLMNDPWIMKWEYE